MTDTSGAVTSAYAYDAFGKLDDSLSLLDLETSYLYRSQQYDPYTKLYSLRARYYDPSQGRFLSRDTWAYDFQNPIELNRYGYTANNPVNFSDPSGNISESAGTYRPSIDNKPALTMIGNFNYRLFGGVVLGTLLALLVGDPTDVERWEDVAQDVQDWLRDEWWNGDPPRGPQYPRWARLILAVVATATFFSPLATKNAIEGPPPTSNPSFYYAEVGFVWRETVDIQSDLSPYLGIAGVEAIKNNLQVASDRYDIDNRGLNYWNLAGRKMEAERAIHYAPQGALMSANPNMPPDFHVRNILLVTYVEVKWTESDYLHPEQSRKIRDAINNSITGMLLVEYNNIGMGLASDLESLGGERYPE
jgi:RHS repeat-associated protein